MAAARTRRARDRIVIVSQAPLVILHDQSELLVTVLVAAAALDIAAAWVRPRLGAVSIVAIAALGPLLLFGLELVQVADRIRGRRTSSAAGSWWRRRSARSSGSIGWLGSTDAGQRAVEAETA